MLMFHFGADGEAIFQALASRDDHNERALAGYADSVVFEFNARGIDLERVYAGLVKVREGRTAEIDAVKKKSDRFARMMALRDLLVSCFDRQGLTQFLSLTLGLDGLVDDLERRRPFAQAVDELLRRKLINADFWGLLRSSRSNRVGEINTLRGDWEKAYGASGESGLKAINGGG